jgi:hypothetical protein
MEVAHKELQSHATTYNVLHAIPEDAAEDEVMIDEHEDDEHDDHHSHSHKHHAAAKKSVHESFDFTDTESLMWRKVSGFPAFKSCVTPTHIYTFSKM